MSITYRPEIDGLRAIAVLSVLFYHADFIGFRGGFIGVDVFFVISGFLITSILLREIAAGSFTYMNFYERRARRILPMIFTIIIAAIPLGLLTMMTNPFEDFADSIISSIFFYSNFFFLNDGGYWGGDNALKPLLHTWSLAVEEQFYILFPPILFLLWKFVKDKLIIALGIGFIASLVVAQWASYQYPLESFFLLPTRAFELLAGAILAAIQFKCGKIEWQYGRFMPVLGIALIAGAVVGFKDTMIHPSIMTMIPVIGSILIICFGSQKNIISIILSTKFFVGIGLISYSLYLWHHMIFAFARIKIVGDVPVIMMVALVILSFVLSYLSWKFIETPFRSRTKITTKKFCLFMMALAVLLSGFALVVKKMEGFPARLPPLAKLANEAADKSLAILYVEGKKCDSQTLENSCEIGNKDAEIKWVLLGDSHMSVISTALAEEIEKRNQYLKTYVQDACFYAPELEFKENGKPAGCAYDINIKRQKILLDMPPQIIVIGGRLSVYLSGDWFDNKEGGVEGTTRFTMQPKNKNLSEQERQTAVKEKVSDSIRELLGAGHKVVLIYPIPEVGINVPQVIGRHAMSKSPKAAQEWMGQNSVNTSYDVFMERNKNVYAVYDSLGENENLLRVYPEKIFCNSLLQSRCITHNSVSIYYADDDHLSLEGSRLLIKEVMKNITEAWKI